MPRSTSVIHHTPQQRTALESWTGSPTLSQHRVLRAKIVLLAAEWRLHSTPGVPTRWSRHISKLESGWLCWWETIADRTH